MSSRLLPTNIPLHCNICPKKPDFSDVSHLLTHIASKGHLSTYYKIKVKASSEDASRHLIEQYDTWYALWSIEDLMSERLNLKDKRKPRSRNAVHASPVPMLPYQMPQPYMPFPGHMNYEHAVDPRLTPQSIKTENVSRIGTPKTAPYFDPMSMHGMQPPYGNPMAPWHPSYMYMTPKHDHYDDEVSSEVSFIPSISTGLKTTADSASTIDGEGDIHEVAETNKLKGVFWPGMDMFDAAAPEQRRKRNQKKDTSVVKQLEAMSQTIEATEHVFSPLGTHCKSRPISGLPDSDDSPLPGEETPPRPKKTKRAPRRKAPIERDANAGRNPPALPQKRGRPTKSAVAARQKVTTNVQGDAKFSARPRKKKGLPLAQDEVEASTFDEIADMNTLTSGFQPQAQPCRAEARSNDTSNVRICEAGYMPQQAYYTYPPQTYFAPTYDAQWDMFSHESSNVVSNPLFFGMEHGSMDFEDDDQQTISVRDSDE